MQQGTEPGNIKLKVWAVYNRSFDPLNSVVCMDETTVQYIKEVRGPSALRRGATERYDAEYERNGVTHLFLNW